MLSTWWQATGPGGTSLDVYADPLGGIRDESLRVLTLLSDDKLLLLLGFVATARTSGESYANGNTDI